MSTLDLSSATLTINHHSGTTDIDIVELYLELLPLQKTNPDPSSLLTSFRSLLAEKYELDLSWSESMQLLHALPAAYLDFKKKFESKLTSSFGFVPPPPTYHPQNNESSPTRSHDSGQNWNSPSSSANPPQPPNGSTPTR